MGTHFPAVRSVLSTPSLGITGLFPGYELPMTSGPVTFNSLSRDHGRRPGCGKPRVPQRSSFNSLSRDHRWRTNLVEIAYDLPGLSTPSLGITRFSSRRSWNSQIYTSFQLPLSGSLDLVWKWLKLQNFAGDFQLPLSGSQKLRPANLLRR